jgi:hypothetical protein
MSAKCHGWLSPEVFRIRLAGVAAATVAAAIALSACAGSGDSWSAAKYDEVLLVPQLRAGWAGWCMVRVNPEGEGGCGGPRSHAPILAEDWSSGGPPALTVARAVMSKEVISVGFGGEPPIRTRADAALPDGLRTVAIVIHGKELLSEYASLPRFIPLDGRGKQIPQTNSGPLEANQGVIAESQPTANASVATASGICEINTVHVAGLTRGEGEVITGVRSYSGLIGQGFLACADTSYSLHGWSPLVSVLLSAEHPGSTPPALPAMTAVPGHPGTFQAPSEEPEPSEDLIARRIPGAWLVVSKGEGLQQRLTLLNYVRARLHL